MKFGQWLGLVALLASLVLLWSLRQSMLNLFGALVLAMGLCTLTGAVRERLNCSRPLALLLSIGLIGTTLGIFLIAVVPLFVDQFIQLLIQVPHAGAFVLDLLRSAIEESSSVFNGRNIDSLTWLKGLQIDYIAAGNALVNSLIKFAKEAGAGIVQLLFVIALALMVAVQPSAYREVGIQLIPSFYRRRFRQVLVQCGNSLSAWMVGVLISSLCVSALSAIGLSLLGVKLVAANALLAGLLNIIPNIGPTLSTVFPMSVAVFDGPWKALAVLLLYIGVQNLESYIITPGVMHKQLKLLPGLTLTAQLVFTVIFGPLGLLLALPLAVCMQVLVREVLIRDILDPIGHQNVEC